MTKTQRLFMWIGIANTIVFAHNVTKYVARDVVRKLENMNETQRIERANQKG